MQFLFVHQNFPGQYKHLLAHLRQDPANRIVFITQKTNNQMRGIVKIEYEPSRAPAPATHHYVRELERGVLNGQGVLRAGLDLRTKGFRPDIMIGHAGWGETLFLKDVFPTAPLVSYFEFFYRLRGADVGFDPAYPTSLDDGPRIRTKNAITLLALDAADWGQTPTAWQRSLLPPVYQPRISLIHEGIDTTVVTPNPRVRFVLGEDGRALTREDEVITYVARNLEPYRGFPSFMRALPEILKQRPQAQILIVGGDEVSYGRKPADGKTWRARMLAELGDALDLGRIHFLGRVPYAQFVEIIQLSSVHVYLTYPFVLSWSLLEAMAAGCIVLGSATAPVQEVIRDGENGFLVDFFSPEAIAERVVAILGNRGGLAAIGAAARETVVGRYDLATVCLPRHLDLIRTLAVGRTPVADPTR